MKKNEIIPSRTRTDDAFRIQVRVEYYLREANLQTSGTTLQKTTMTVPTVVDTRFIIIAL